MLHCLNSLPNFQIWIKSHIPGTFRVHRWRRPKAQILPMRSDAIIAIAKWLTSKGRREARTVDNSHRPHRQPSHRSTRKSRKSPWKHASTRATRVRWNVDQDRRRDRRTVSRAFMWVKLDAILRFHLLYESIHPQSASSLLLTVANLESFAKIQENSSRLHHHHTNAAFTGARVFSIKQSHLMSSTTKPAATKDADQLSTASSTHFTMINGFGRSQSSGKSSFICKRSQQVTVLIVTMSLLFLIGIFTAVILLESE